MACSVVPYEGKEPYLFVSYSHSDSSRVFPILEALEKRGFRIWFDQGIELGAEWPESVAMHLSNCTVCLAFLSQNAVQSVNCRQEISYAIKQKKGILSVYLEKTDLSMGLDMQLSAYQQVFSTQYADKDRFYAQLESTPVLQPCRRQETPGPSAQSHTGRRIVRLAVAALAVLALACAGAWAWLGRGGEEPSRTPPPPYHVILTAHEDCSVREFNQAVSILQGRLDAFADGADYEMTVEGDAIDLRIPREMMGGLELEAALKCYFSRAIELYAFCQNDSSLSIALSRQDLARVSLEHGALEGVDAEALGIAGETYPYIEIELTGECAERIREETASWGEGLAFAQDMELSTWYSYYTFPAGDGKTFRVLNTDGERYARALVYNLTHDSFAYSFYYSVVLDDIEWEDASSSAAGRNQCDGEANTEASATICLRTTRDALSDGERIDSLAVLRARLDALDQPYAIGQRDGSPDCLFVKTGLAHLGDEILGLLCTGSPYFCLRAGEMSESYSPQSVKAVDLGDGRFGLQLALKDNELEKGRAFLAYAVESGGEITLAINSMALCAGTIDAVPDDGVLTLDRLLLLSDGRAQEEDTWVFRLLERIGCGQPLPVPFYVSSCQFFAGEDGMTPTREDFGVANQTLLAQQREISRALNALYPETEVWFDGSSAYVQLDLPVNDALPAQGASMAHAIYDEIDFAHGPLELLTVYLTPEDNASWERARIFFRKDYAGYSYSHDRPDRMFIYYYSVFRNGRLEPLREAFRETLSGDPFYQSLYKPDFSLE